jgi:hypothetical protein
MASAFALRAISETILNLAKSRIIISGYALKAVL